MNGLEISDVVSKHVIKSAIIDFQKKVKNYEGCYSLTEQGFCDSANFSRANKIMSISYDESKLVISVNNCKSKVEYTLEEGKAPHLSRTLPAPSVGTINNVSDVIGGIVKFYLQ